MTLLLQLNMGTTPCVLWSKEPVVSINVRDMESILVMFHLFFGVTPALSNTSHAYSH
jgi:hypothetical protein